MQDLLDRGDAEAVVRVLPGFARDIAARPDGCGADSGGWHEFQHRVASSSAMRRARWRGFRAKSMQRRQRERIAPARLRPARRCAAMFPQLTARTPRRGSTPTCRAATISSRASIANIIMLVTLMLTSMAIVREKEIGTMEQLMVTPIRPIELMLGKTLPFAAGRPVRRGAGDDRGAGCFSTSRCAGASCCCCVRALFPDDDARRGTVHLDDFAHATAGHDVDVSLLSTPSSC